MKRRTLLTAILDRLEGLEVTGEPVVATRMFLRGLTSLPVRATIRERTAAQHLQGG